MAAARPEPETPDLTIPVPLILVIEDDEALGRVLCRGLERAGYRTVRALNGAEGIRSCRATPADLVITDIHMPEMDGIETMLELRRAWPRLRIIATTGGPDPQAKGGRLDDARLLGAVRTVAKPFTLEDMLSAVREALGSGEGR